MLVPLERLNHGSALERKSPSLIEFRFVFKFVIFNTGPGQRQAEPTPRAHKKIDRMPLLGNEHKTTCKGIKRSISTLVFYFSV